jgi:hypothetical protein
MQYEDECEQAHGQCPSDAREGLTVGVGAVA